MRRGTPVIRTALLLAVLLGSLTLVVWRQSRALEILRQTEEVRRERVVAEARRAALARRVEQLGSRSRVSDAARDRFGMRLPEGGEIVILPFFEPAAGLAGGKPAGAEGADPVVDGAATASRDASRPGGAGEGRG